MNYCKDYCEEREISTSKLNEAQKTLYYIAENMKKQKSISEDGYEHFQQAIKILEQPTSSDCVSRDTIRLKIAEMPKYTEGKKSASTRHLEEFLEKEMEEPIEVTPELCEGFALALEYIGKFIKELPPVTPTQNWIPIDKKLPEEYSDVIACTDKDEVFIASYLGKMNDGTECFDDDNGMMWDGDVIAWAPKPKSYKADKEA